MGQKKCGKCGIFGHNARTCGKTQDDLNEFIDERTKKNPNFPKMVEARSVSLPEAVTIAKQNFNRVEKALAEEVDRDAGIGAEPEIPPIEPKPRKLANESKRRNLPLTMKQVEELTNLIEANKKQVPGLWEVFRNWRELLRKE